ncbi:hypothetical protein [Amycolatopsis aidingensis]|uniref:hypothetical protein n=1 Tax=Amycolatopsis aidingensis TaxID=2842453 RepID=UPI001C0B9E5B|nr:hypothetical protein [Amycolatopsis aidingensis]
MLNGSRKRSRPWHRLAATCGAAVLVSGLLSAGTAAAAPVTFNYDVTGGTATVEKLGSTLELGQGSLSAHIDVASGEFVADLDMDTAHGEFTVFGFVPVSADLDLIPQGQTTGKIDGGSVTAEANVTLKLSNVKVAGVPAFIGDNCRTKTPATVSLASAPGFNPLVGGDLLSTFTIPKFSGCKVLTVIPWVADLALDALIAGPDNDLKLTLAWAN